MMRVPVSRVFRKVKQFAPLTQSSAARGYASAPEKVEVFIDDKRVLVDPGTTVLQVTDSRQVALVTTTVNA